MEEQEKAQAPAQQTQTLQAMPICTAKPFAVILATGSEKEIEAAVKREIYITDVVRKFSLKLTSIADWIDQGGNPYLQWTGTSKIAAKIGIEMRLNKDINGNVKFDEEIRKDDEGECLDITVSGVVIKDGMELPEVGTASSRDSLWGVRKDANGKSFFIPLSEIDRTDIKKKAVTNFMNRALKSRMGYSFTWEEIAEATGGAITREKVVGAGKGVSYAKGSKGGSTEAADTKSIRAEVWNWIMEMCDGEENAAHKMLAEKSGFEGRDQQTGEPKWVNGKENIADFTEAWVKKLHAKIKQDYAVYKKQFNNEGYGEAQPPAAEPAQPPAAGRPAQASGKR